MNASVSGEQARRLPKQGLVMLQGGETLLVIRGSARQHGIARDDAPFDLIQPHLSAKQGRLAEFAAPETGGVRLPQADPLRGTGSSNTAAPFGG